MARYRKKPVEVDVCLPDDGSSDKVWFGIWIAWTALLAIIAVSEVVTGGDWLKYAIYAMLCINICLLHWRIWHEQVRIVISPGMTVYTGPERSGEESS